MTTTSGSPLVSLHSLDESLLDQWDSWSRQSEAKDGECARRWRSFSKEDGRGIGSLIHVAQEHGGNHPRFKALGVDDVTLEHAAQLLAEIESQEARPKKKVVSTTDLPFPSMSRGGWTQPVINDKKGKDSKKRNPSSDAVTDVVLQLWKGNLRYCQTQGCFYLYEYKGKGLWTQLSDIEIKGEIKNKFEI